MSTSNSFRQLGYKHTAASCYDQEELMLTAPTATAEGGRLARKDKGGLKDSVYINNKAPIKLNAFILCVAKNDW